MHEDIVKIGHGEVGGKSSGFLNIYNLFQNIIKKNENKHASSFIAFPYSFFVTTEIFKDFIKVNKLEHLIKSIESGENSNYEEIKTAFLNGNFSQQSKESIFKILDIIKDPIAIRSSSLLEDQKDASFAGKYESVFFGNQGPDKQRQESFLKAIKEVYSSTYNPSALAYRRKHGFIDDNEEMALLIQSVVGQRYGQFFLPAMAGVGFSQNGYCWSKEIKKEDGLIRLVFGLGTRAVGRGYVRLFSPAKPELRPEGTEVNNIQKCSQKKIDVVNLEDNKIKDVHFRELIKDGLNCYPGSQSMISLRDGNHLYKPISNIWDSTHMPVLTMDDVLVKPWNGLPVAKTLGWILMTLEKAFGYAVDIEFAICQNPETKEAKIYLLQTRPLSEADGRKSVPVPNLNNNDIIFSVQRNLPTAYITNIEYLVYVNDIAYHEWPHREKQSVARVIGKINEVLKDKKYALIGPGRWGSWNPDLGVPVNYAEISNCVMLIEIARRQATYVPEVSFGSHFFQDLIEDNIAYFPVYPDEPNVIFNENFFNKKSVFKELLPDDYYRQFDDLIKIISVPVAVKDKNVHAILNGEEAKAVIFLGEKKYN